LSIWMMNLNKFSRERVHFNLEERGKGKGNMYE